MAGTKAKTIEVKVERSIKATPAQLFDVWLDAKSPGSPWFGTANAIVNPAVDGLFYHCVNFENHDWAHYGRFLVLERSARIEHTWVSEATRGLESVVTLTFEPDGERTRMTIHHRNLPDDEMGRRHKEGWTFMLDSFEQVFGS
jgi:uncharacterized protein YndB with AHSA1/START domain